MLAAPVCRLHLQTLSLWEHWQFQSDSETLEALQVGHAGMPRDSAPPRKDPAWSSRKGAVGHRGGWDGGPERAQSRPTHVGARAGEMS